jgi:hypothetical protein
VPEAIAPRAVLRFAGAYLNGHQFDPGGWEDGFAANAALQVRHLAGRGHTRIAIADSALPPHRKADIGMLARAPR